ncbi:MAG TPA: hypothetical protein DCL74_06280 [Succinivibrionaceae bacterium]|nr:hypothetical protein [Succinivibrionaceae bacterium]
MQDMIARALALRNSGSSSGLSQRIQKIEDEYVRAVDENSVDTLNFTPVAHTTEENKEDTIKKIKVIDGDNIFVYSVDIDSDTLILTLQ